MSGGLVFTFTGGGESLCAKEAWGRGGTIKCQKGIITDLGDSSIAEISVQRERRAVLSLVTKSAASI